MSVNLPLEILVYIFKYISPSDRKAASETCKLWYLAANNYCFLKNKTVIFNTPDLNEETSAIHIFYNSTLPYQKYLFSEVEVSSKLNFFWDSVGANIKSLILDNCEISEQVFSYIIQKCENLEELSIECCRDLFMSGRLLENKNKDSQQLTNLKVLSLSGNQYLTDVLFSRLAETSPYLEKINLTLCSIQFHIGLLKRFYPPNIDVTNCPSDCVLTFYAIWMVIEHRAKYIQSVILSRTLIDGKALQKLCQIPNLKLKSLDLNFCDQITRDGLMSLTQYQTQLCELNLGFCTRVTDEILSKMCNDLVNIEFLDIQRCRFLSDSGVSELHKLKKLKSLNISECELVTSTGLINAICPEKNTVLRILDVHSLNLDEYTIEKISSHIVNLHTLNVSYCLNAVTDKSIRSVFKNLTSLRILKLSGCMKITDAGLCGEEGRPDTVDHKFSLTRLAGLKELDISGCKNITDSTLHSFSFKELVTLNLSTCQKITHFGVNTMVENCPAIESLNLSDCFNMNDYAVKTIVQHLKRLHFLKLRGCPLITDNTIEAIRTHCKNLKVLDVQGCRKLNLETVRSIETPILRTVLISKPGPYNL